MSKIKQWLKDWLGVEELQQQTARVVTGQAEVNERIEGRIDKLVIGIGKNNDGMMTLLKLETAQRQSQIDALNIDKRLIDLETRNEKPVERPPEPSPAGSWTSMVNRIENGGSRRVPRPGV